jgi:RNA:NAD 2'-phosphotransferase (TPT1/KptA family)
MTEERGERREKILGERRERVERKRLLSLILKHHGRDAIFLESFLSFCKFD